jgi:hypothetical protein
VGNRTFTIINGVTTTYTSNSVNEYTSVGSTQFSYDADGNLISQIDLRDMIECCGRDTRSHQKSDKRRSHRLSWPVSRPVPDPCKRQGNLTCEGRRETCPR